MKSIWFYCHLLLLLSDLFIALYHTYTSRTLNIVDLKSYGNAMTNTNNKNSLLNGQFHEQDSEIVFDQNGEAFRKVLKKCDKILSVNAANDYTNVFKSKTFDYHLPIQQFHASLSDNYEPIICEHGKQLQICENNNKTEDDTQIIYDNYINEYGTIKGFIINCMNQYGTIKCFTIKQHNTYYFITNIIINSSSCNS